jgi:hypothetical protein
VNIDHCQHLPLITTKGKNYPLGVAERVVYSWLAYRGRLGLAGSIREIASGTTLDRRTVRKCIDALGGLLQCNGEKWSAAEPGGAAADWFAARKAKYVKHWSDRLASIKLFVPSPGARVEGHRFTLNHAAVYAELRSFGRRGSATITIRGLSTLLNGMNETTIRSALTMLKTAGLLQVAEDSGRLRVTLLPLMKNHLALFIPRVQKETVDSGTRPDEPTTPTFTLPEYASAYTRCLDLQIPQALAIRITELCGRFPDFCYDDFVKLTRTAEQEHLRNCLNGRFNVRETPHCGHLLLYKVKCLLDLDQRRRQMRVMAYPTLDELERYRAERAKEEEILADPHHPLRTERFAEGDIRRRVNITSDEASKLIGLIERHIGQHVLAVHPTLSVSTQADLEVLCQFADLQYQSVMAAALGRLNEYDNRPRKADRDQFYRAINAALQEGGDNPLFEVADIVPNETQARPPMPQWLHDAVDLDLQLRKDEGHGSLWVPPRIREQWRRLTMARVRSVVSDEEPKK